MIRNILSLIVALLLATSISFAKVNAGGTDTSVVKKGKLLPIILTESALYAGSMAYLQFIWYKDHQRVPFHYYNDNAGYLQIDKFGHAFGSYLESYTGYHLLRGAGVKKKQALIYGATLGIVLQTPIEIFDGMYEGWGFSWGDMIANTTGSALVVGQELLFDEQIVKMKFSFWQSPYAKQANGYLGENFLQSLFYDYNGHTYWLSMPMNKVMLKNKLPDWASIAIGYSANGMFGEFENKTYYRGVDIPQTARERQFILSLDIDWTKVKTDSKVLKKLLKGMFFVKLPFPAIEISSGGKIKGHLLYW
jgi:uncharacterized protein YfiM (DUF2279 family)